DDEQALRLRRDLRQFSLQDRRGPHTPLLPDRPEQFGAGRIPSDRMGKPDGLPPRRSTPRATPSHRGMAGRGGGRVARHRGRHPGEPGVEALNGSRSERLTPPPPPPPPPLCGGDVGRRNLPQPTPEIATMKKSDVKQGGYYLMNHSSGFIPVQIMHEISRNRPTTRGRASNSGWISMTHWKATNLKTGRTIEIKSAARLKRGLSQQEIDAW